MTMLNTAHLDLHFSFLTNIFQPKISELKDDFNIFLKNIFGVSFVKKKVNNLRIQHSL